MRLSIICKQCGISKEVWPSVVKRGSGKFCSNKCYGLSKKGIPVIKKGFKHSKEGRAKMGLNHVYKIGSNNHIWVGDNAGYGTLHGWVRRHLGSASHCEEEDRTCIGRFEWANISGIYLRDLLDWKQLCRSHHIRFDKNNGHWGKAKEIFEQKKSNLSARRVIL